MKNNPDSFWASRDVAVTKMLKQPKIAVYDFVRELAGREEFKKCLINHIPKVYDFKFVIFSSLYLFADISKVSGGFRCARILSLMILSTIL